MWSFPLTNVTWHSVNWPYTMTTPYWSDCTKLDLLPNFEWFPLNICDGYGMPTGDAYSKDTWSRPFGTRICSTCWDQSFSEIVVIFPDYALRISLGTFSILLLYYALVVVERYGDVALIIDGISTVDVDTQGNGIFAELLRTVVDTLIVNDTFCVDLNFTLCLPNLSKPQTSYNPAIVILYAVAVVFAILNTYALRLRCAIAASFFPEQEETRIHHLHEKLIYGRMTFFHWLRDLVLLNFKKGSG